MTFSDNVQLFCDNIREFFGFGCGIAADPKKSRLTTGKIVEQQIADLIHPLFGLAVHYVTETQDRGGVDRFVTTPRGRMKTLQIKYRETGEDILVDVY